MNVCSSGALISAQGCAPTSVLCKPVKMEEEEHRLAGEPLLGPRLLKALGQFCEWAPSSWWPRSSRPVQPNRVHIPHLGQGPGTLPIECKDKACWSVLG